MLTHEVRFFSGGAQMGALWRTLDEFGGQLRAIVQGPGWLGLKDSKLYVRYHEALTAAGFGVLVFDYRGLGDSEGGRGLLSPSAQLQDLVNAVTYLTTREDVDADRIGAFGTGRMAVGRYLLLVLVDEHPTAHLGLLQYLEPRDVEGAKRWLAGHLDKVSAAWSLR